jgi:biopolymer transport protein ExbD
MRRNFALPADPAPMSAINITPLIDVMLVLLIMLILTIPAVTHKVPVDLPSPAGGAPAERPTHRLAIDAGGRLSWDGATLADAALPARLRAATAEGAVLHLETDAAARYERFDQVLATVRRAGIERLGFVGNERFAAF